MNAPKTVDTALELGRVTLRPHTSTPQQNALLILSQVLGKPKEWLLTHPETDLALPDSQAFLAALKKCEAGEALPYVLGWWEFYGRKFRVSPDVLIPRPETEWVVESGLEFLTHEPRRRRVADIGTGSGCVAITLAAEIADLEVIATDLSSEALSIARENAKKHGVLSRLRFLLTDLLTALEGPFDLICANLPYIPSDTLNDLKVVKREPRLALDGGDDGLEVLLRLIHQLPFTLAPEGRAVLEMGAEQSLPLSKVLQEKMPSATTHLRKDLAGIDRVLVIDRANG